MRFFLNSSIFFLSSILLWGCKEQIEHTSDYSQDTIIYDQYINYGLEFSMRIPLHWDTIPQSEIEGWNAVGQEIIGTSKRMIPDYKLIALQHVGDSTKSTLKLTCIPQKEFPNLRRAHQFAKYNQQVLDSSFSRIGVASHSKLAKRKTSAADFESLQMYFNTRTGGIFNMEIMYLYRKDQIITITFSYGSESDSLELYKSLETFIFTQ